MLWSSMTQLLAVQCVLLNKSFGGVHTLPLVYGLPFAQKNAYTRGITFLGDYATMNN